MNRRSLLRRLITLPAAAVAAVAAGSSTTAKETAKRVIGRNSNSDHPKLNQYPVSHDYVFTDRSGAKWKIWHTGFKASAGRGHLLAQVCAWPINEAGTSDEYRPFLVSTCGGKVYHYRRGQEFDVSAITPKWHPIEAGDTQTEKYERLVAMESNLIQFVNHKAAKVKWREYQRFQAYYQSEPSNWLPVDYLYTAAHVGTQLDLQDKVWKELIG